ncbi:MAG TPA: HNH endonuclease, partial [Xylella fastidiosa subsp. pauca]
MVTVLSVSPFLPSPSSASMRFLSLDACGRVLDWISWQDAACLYVRDAVSWT